MVLFARRFAGLLIRFASFIIRFTLSLARLLVILALSFRNFISGLVLSLARLIAALALISGSFIIGLARLIVGLAFIFWLLLFAFRGFIVAALAAHKLEETALFAARRLLLIKQGKLLLIKLLEKRVPGDLFQRFGTAIARKVDAQETDIAIALRALDSYRFATTCLSPFFDCSMIDRSFRFASHEPSLFYLTMRFLNWRNHRRNNDCASTEFLFNYALPTGSSFTCIEVAPFHELCNTSYVISLFQTHKVHALPVEFVSQAYGN